MTNGFYDISIFKTKKQKVDFIKDCILYCYDVNIQVKYDTKFQREKDDKSSINEYFNKMVNPDLHCINRKLYYNNEIKDAQAEITLVEDWNFVYCFLTIKNLDKIIKKYKLKLKNW